MIETTESTLRISDSLASLCNEVATSFPMSIESPKLRIDRKLKELGLLEDNAQANEEKGLALILMQMGVGSSYIPDVISSRSILSHDDAEVPLDSTETPVIASPSPSKKRDFDASTRSDSSDTSEGSDDSKESALKKKRQRTSPDQLSTLETTFQTDQMPNQQTRLELAQKLGMSSRRVQIWFQNKRAKVKRTQKQHVPHVHQSSVAAPLGVTIPTSPMSVQQVDTPSTPSTPPTYSEINYPMNRLESTQLPITTPVPNRPTLPPLPTPTTLGGPMHLHPLPVTALIG